MDSSIGALIYQFGGEIFSTVFIWVLLIDLILLGALLFFKAVQTVGRK